MDSGVPSATLCTPLAGPHDGGVRTTSDSEEVPDTYAAIVGERLRAVRRQKRLSLQAVAAASGQEFKASVLGAYERGERAISVPRLQRLAVLYEVPVDQLLPERMAGGNLSSLPRARRELVPARVAINLVEVKAASGELAAALQRFVATIELERQDFNGQVLTVRTDDLRLIGATLGLSIEEMVEKLDELGLLYEH